MVKKAIDSRIPALIRNGAQQKTRSFFVVVGDRQKDVIVNLYHILLNTDLKLNKSVLWAYKNKLLGFTSHRKKREKKIKKEIKRGIRDADTEDPFELFVSTQDVRYVYYKETDKILGNTYGMCILQDFEAITPNLLARTMETVEGGGIVLLLLKGMDSLKQLYSLSMDIHSRYRTEAHADVVGRFNERFILSLGSCESCLVIDDELNVLPISGGKNVKPLPPQDLSVNTGSTGTAAADLSALKQELADNQPMGPLVQLSKTLDQAKALLTFADAIAEKTLQSTVALTAGRGRGKSAALGLSIAAAVAHGYSNIFITSPSPENLKTLFEFVFKGFDALGYLDHHDYSIIQSTNPDFNKAIVRVNVYRRHRQTIQYIQPQDAYMLGQAELLVIDEAAAIPLPFVKKLLGPYLVFMASTINGYEGTGRSLSLKLINQLREQSRGISSAKAGDTASAPSQNSRSLREVTLTDPIRYAAGDPVEKWLNRLLCLDATLPAKLMSSTSQGTPHPSQCELLAVNRDTLFSFHPVSERFLQSMVSLYVASHYKNTPNDLQLMSDAPAHHLYVLVPPLSADAQRLPEPLVVIQVALEGRISKASVQAALSRGQRAGGDLIPWVVSQQFQDDDFASLSGARIVRIATNPDYASMGYGARAITLLSEYYAGKFLNLTENETIPTEGQLSFPRVTNTELESSALHTDNIKIRDIQAMPPLFSRLSEVRPPATLDYIGVSYGLTPQLHKFWKRAGFVPVYLRQTPNDLTGEHTSVMLRTLNADGSQCTWLSAFAKDFHKRFLSLLSYQFRSFPAVLALSIDESAGLAFRATGVESTAERLTKASLDEHFTSHDMARLERYASNMLDHHAILDLLPAIASLYFAASLRSAVRLSGVQSALLLAVGCQRRAVEDVATDLGLSGPNGISQLLAMFVKLIRKIVGVFRNLEESHAGRDLPFEAADQDDGGHSGAHGSVFSKALDQSVEDELLGSAGNDGQDVQDTYSRDSPLRAEDKAEQDRRRAMIDALPLDKYGSTANDDEDWGDAERQVQRLGGKGRVVSVPKSSTMTTKRKAGEALLEAHKENDRLAAQSGNKPKKKKGKAH